MLAHLIHFIKANISETFSNFVCWLVHDLTLKKYNRSYHAEIDLIADKKLIHEIHQIFFDKETTAHVDKPDSFHKIKYFWNILQFCLLVGPRLAAE